MEARRARIGILNGRVNRNNGIAASPTFLFLRAGYRFARLQECIDVAFIHK